jgi:hypothetical protein
MSIDEGFLVGSFQKYHAAPLSGKSVARNELRLGLRTHIIIVKIIANIVDKTHA